MAVLVLVELVGPRQDSAVHDGELLTVLVRALIIGRLGMVYALI